MIDTKALRSRVLDLAIQGKLTEQLESDGTAEELYQQIQTEKQRLVKEGKIKTEKPLPEIKPEEVPFEIPKSWKWVRMGAVYSFNPSVEADENTDAAFIPMERISAGYNRDFSFEVQKWSVASKNHTKFSNGDVAFAKITPCFENRKSFYLSGCDAKHRNQGGGGAQPRHSPSPLRGRCRRQAAVNRSGRNLLLQRDCQMLLAAAQRNLLFCGKR